MFDVEHFSFVDITNQRFARFLFEYFAKIGMGNEERVGYVVNGKIVF